MAFGGYLKQSTAVDILLGPFLDDADGDTADTDATIDVELSKNGQALADSESAAPTHDAAGDVDGYYNCVLGTTDTDTLGILTVVAHHADDLPVRLDFQVVTANWYDSMCSTDVLQADLTQIGGVAQSATDLKDLADTGYDPATHKIQSDLIYIHGSALTETAGQLAAAFIKFFDVAAPTATALSLPDAVPGAVGGGFIAGTNAETTVTTALNAAITGNITGDLSGSIDSYTGNTPQTADNNTLLTAIAGYLDTEIAAIVAAVITNAAGVDVAADIIALKAETVAIKAKTDLLPSGIPKNTALAAFEWLMVLAADHISPATGKTVVCQRSIDGAAFANCNTTPATEVSDGIYKVDLAASDLNGDVITLKFTEATCDTTLITIKTDT